MELIDTIVTRARFGELFNFMDNGRKIPIHIRTPKTPVLSSSTSAKDLSEEISSTDTAKRSEHAHNHVDDHQKNSKEEHAHHVRKQKEHESHIVHLETKLGGEAERTLPIIRILPTRYAEALVPSKRIIPQKPMFLSGLPMSSLAIAYFCMEIGINDRIPSYSGGLGLLAGDMLQSCADMMLDMVGVSLLYHKGYFTQRIDDSGWQYEEGTTWNPHEYMTLLPHTVEVVLEGRTVVVHAWLYKVEGRTGHVNPIIFLDTDSEENAEIDRALTMQLYSGDTEHRVKQEAILGIAGIRMLKKIGATNIQKFHMNEGHAALLTLELYHQYEACDDPLGEVKRRAVFTTHTPVAAGHDRFPRDMVLRILGGDYIPSTLNHQVWDGETLNMTKLGLNMSQYVNGVARKHGEVSRELFPGYAIDSITNGVHPTRWVAPPIATLFDHYIPYWRSDPANLRYALTIPLEELWSAHQHAKRDLIAVVRERTGVEFSEDVLTIGFARRATGYKRGNMLFHDMERLKHIASTGRGIQLVFAGKAHPQDRDGKLLMQQIIWRMRELAGSKVSAVYLPDYDSALARVLVSGVDCWLNTPARPMEASGTSGMKAALNGVPHFSTLDGWWLEGHLEDMTGWSIGPHPENAHGGDVDGEDANDLYTKLEYVLLPKYEGDQSAWTKMMRFAIAINGSFFNTERMVMQYVLSAYFK